MTDEVGDAAEIAPGRPIRHIDAVTREAIVEAGWVRESTSPLP